MSRFKISVGLIIGLGFGVLIAFIVFVNLSTNSTLAESKNVNNEMVKVHSPSVDKLQELKILILRSRSLIDFWVQKDVPIEHEKKQELLGVINNGYPKIKSDIISVSQLWDDREDVHHIDHIFTKIEALFTDHEIVMGMLQKVEDYNKNDAISGLEGFEMFEDLNDLAGPEQYISEAGAITMKTNEIIPLLDKLIDIQRGHSKEDTDKIIESYSQLEFLLNYLGWALVLGGLLIAFFTIRTITRPVGMVKDQLLLLGQGIIPSQKVRTKTKELNQMALALEDLASGLNRTKDFATQVGEGNFKAEFTPLSDQDLLGQSLLTMRKDLFELTSDLEQKVKDRTKTIEEQKEEIEVLLKHTTDSIVYAKRIQDAILPTDTYISQVLPNSFFFFAPKDIVSGDFYWVFKEKNKVFYGVIDCTGHGVPGAFMTIIGYNGLMKAIKNVKVLSPAAVLDTLNQEVRNTFSQHGLEEQSIKDGMDAAICAIDYKNMSLEYAGAFNPLYYIRNEEIHEVKPNKFPVGLHYGNKEEKFTNHTLELKKDDVIYIFSDGYPDQFGGEKGKKYKYRKFRELLLKIHKKDPSIQKKLLLKEYENWKNDLEQVDDILVAGVKI